jgi:alkaline phosphatase D
MKEEGRYMLLVSKRPFCSEGVLVPEGLLKKDKKDRFSVTCQLAFGKKKSVKLCGRYLFTLAYKTDNTGVVDVLKLKEGRRYYYAVAKLLDNAETGRFEWELGHEKTASFMTMSKKSNNFSFGLYSCHMPYAHGIFEDKVDARLWDNFSQELDRDQARFIIGAGDQVYVDGNKKVNIWRWLEKVRDHQPTDADMVSWYRDIYRGYWGFPKFQEVYQSYPNYMIWDDHEIMDGWGSFTNEELSQEMDALFRWEDEKENTDLAYRMFDAAKKVYKEYQHSHNPSTKQDALDYSFDGCGADFFVMDMRSSRTVTEILGSAQTGRLNKWLASLEESSKNPLPIFIVSPVPVVHLKDIAMNIADWVSLFGTKDDVRDHWEHKLHKKELEDFLEASFSTANRLKRPLVFLSGDVHVGLIAKIANRNYPDVKAFQVTSSGISYAGLNNASRMALEAAAKKEGNIKGNKDYRYFRHWIYAGNNFSLIRVQKERGKLTEIEVSIHGNTGEDQPLQTHRINLLSL